MRIKIFLRLYLLLMAEHSANHTKCMDFFKQEHEKFFEGTLLLNAWYSCLYQNPAWNRAEVSLDDSFPSEWLDLDIGNITHNYTQADIEAKFHKAPKIDEESVNARVAELRALGYLRLRGKFEIQFLFAFLSFLKNEPRNNRKYTVASCSLPFQQNTMISTFLVKTVINHIKLYKNNFFFRKGHPANHLQIRQQ